jgi:hypothetical protein
MRAVCLMTIMFLYRVRSKKNCMETIGWPIISIYWVFRMCKNICKPLSILSYYRGYKYIQDIICVCYILSIARGRLLLMIRNVRKTPGLYTRLSGRHRSRRAFVFGVWIVFWGAESNPAFRMKTKSWAFEHIFGVFVRKSRLDSRLSGTIFSYVAVDLLRLIWTGCDLPLFQLI